MINRAPSVAPGVTGMANVDKNSCYALVVLQALAHIPQLVRLMLLQYTSHRCTGKSCVYCLVVAMISKLYRSCHGALQKPQMKELLKLKEMFLHSGFDVQDQDAFVCNVRCTRAQVQSYYYNDDQSDTSDDTSSFGKLSRSRDASPPPRYGRASAQQSLQFRDAHEFFNWLIANLDKIDTPQTAVNDCIGELTDDDIRQFRQDQVLPGAQSVLSTSKPAPKKYKEQSNKGQKRRRLKPTAPAVQPKKFKPAVGRTTRTSIGARQGLAEEEKPRLSDSQQQPVVESKISLQDAPTTSGQQNTRAASNGSLCKEGGLGRAAQGKVEEVEGDIKRESADIKMEDQVLMTEYDSAKQTMKQDGEAVQQKPVCFQSAIGQQKQMQPNFYMKQLHEMQQQMYSNAVANMQRAIPQAATQYLPWQSSVLSPYSRLMQNVPYAWPQTNHLFAPYMSQFTPNPMLSYSNNRVGSAQLPNVYSRDAWISMNNLSHVGGMYQGVNPQAKRTVYGADANAMKQRNSVMQSRGSRSVDGGQASGQNPQQQPVPSQQMRGVMGGGRERLRSDSGVRQSGSRRVSVGGSAGGLGLTQPSMGALQSSPASVKAITGARVSGKVEEWQQGGGGQGRGGAVSGQCAGAAGSQKKKASDIVDLVSDQSDKDAGKDTPVQTRGGAATANTKSGGSRRLQDEAGPSGQPQATPNVANSPDVKDYADDDLLSFRNAPTAARTRGRRSAWRGRGGASNLRLRILHGSSTPSPVKQTTYNDSDTNDAGVDNNRNGDMQISPSRAKVGATTRRDWAGVRTRSRRTLKRRDMSKKLGDSSGSEHEDSQVESGIQNGGNARHGQPQDIATASSKASDKTGQKDGKQEAADDVVYPINAKGRIWLNRLFQGSLKYITTCHCCGQFTQTQQIFTEIPVHFQRVDPNAWAEGELGELAKLHSLYDEQQQQELLDNQQRQQQQQEQTPNANDGSANGEGPTDNPDNENQATTTPSATPPPQNTESASPPPTRGRGGARGRHRRGQRGRKASGCARGGQGAGGAGPGRPKGTKRPAPPQFFGSIPKCVAGVVEEVGYSCSFCSAKIAERSCRTSYAPDILIFQLAVFDYNQLTRDGHKLQYYAEVPEHLQLELVNGAQVEYMLRASVCHIGKSLSTGHYTVYVRHMGSYYYIDNQTVTKVAPHEHDKMMWNLSTLSYLVFYTKVVVHGTNEEVADED